MHQPIGCAAKVTTPYIQQSAKGNLRVEADLADLATLTLTLPMQGLRVEVVLAGADLEQLQKQLATEIRKAKRQAKARAEQYAQQDAEAVA